MLDKTPRKGYTINRKGRCDKRLARNYGLGIIKNCHLPGWRFLLFTVPPLPARGAVLAGGLLFFEKSAGKTIKFLPRRTNKLSERTRKQRGPAAAQGCGRRQGPAKPRGRGGQTACKHGPQDGGAVKVQFLFSVSFLARRKAAQTRCTAHAALGGARGLE